MHRLVSLLPAVLIAALVTFGVLNRNSEIVAMKATGISLYRLVIPIASIAAALAVCLFLFDQYYLPQANRHQEALLNIIKGKPAQTVLHPEQKWMFGQPRTGEPGRIFYYQFFDSDRDEFANLSVFEFDPSTFALTRRIFAGRVAWNASTDQWQFENGWVRDLKGAIEYREFGNTTFAEIHEEPGYFKKESFQSQEMNFEQAVAAQAFTIIGKGSIDFPGFFEVLGKNGYTGWMVVEQDVKFGATVVPPVESVAASLRYLEGVVGKL